jgi:cyclopropane fatty-acyl-phospholipid synthase-like methyltransferase
MSKKEEWNSRYASVNLAYGSEPNEFLVSVLKDAKPGSILFPGEGEGRNSLWAAKNGWKVASFDFSSEAKAKAQKLYNEHGVSVNYSISEALTYNPFQQFDAIALIFFHLPSAERTTFFKNCYSWLKPNGVLIMECFHSDQIGLFSGGPKDPDLFHTIEELKETFSEMNFEILRKQEIILNEGPLHQGKAIVIRAFGRKV